MNKEELKRELTYQMDRWTGNHEPSSDILIDNHLIPIAESYATSQTEALKKEIEELEVVNKTLDGIIDEIKNDKNKEVRLLRKNMAFCLDIIDNHVDDFRLKQPEIDKLKQIKEF